MCPLGNELFILNSSKFMKISNVGHFMTILWLNSYTFSVDFLELIVLILDGYFNSCSSKIVTSFEVEEKLLVSFMQKNWKIRRFNELAPFYRPVREEGSQPYH